MQEVYCRAAGAGEERNKELFRTDPEPIGMARVLNYPLEQK